MDISNIICMSLHDDDATIVGAKESTFLDDRQIEEDGLDYQNTFGKYRK